MPVLLLALLFAPPRLLVTTDIGGDPDDTQSLVRLLVHANEFEIEGLIASASGTPGELKADVVKPELIREVVHAYYSVQPNLARHAPGFPSCGTLLARIKQGNPKRGMASLGEGKDTEGSEWIIRMADREDPRPLNIAIWGGSTELAQALWKVRATRSRKQLDRFLAKLRVYDINHQDDTGPWIVGNFPALFYILAKAAEGRDRREGAYRGMYLGGDESLTSLDWVRENVQTGHGPLGALYPLKTWTAPNPHGVLKEGDTPSWFFFLANGLNVPEHPEYGGWGGRFTRQARGRFYRDAADRVGDTIDPRATVWRWRPAFQNEFAARMDWCVKDPAETNHKPLFTRPSPERLRVKPGARVTFDASDASDPDGHELTYKWWQYAEAGTYQGALDLGHCAGAPRCAADIPADAAGSEIHVILEVTDTGAPPLTAYRRTILLVNRKP